jgi:hypothetical protein
MSNAKTGPGFILSKGDGGGPEVFTTIGEVGAIAGPGMKTDTHDVTNQSSPGGIEEVAATIIRTEDVTFPVNLNANDPTHDNNTGLAADQANRVVKNFRLGLKTGTKYIQFAALVINFKVMAPVTGVLVADITLKPTGQWTWGG